MEVARQEVAVRICSCPGRDVKNEEDRLRKKTHLEPQSNDEDQRYGEPRFDRVSLSINLGENPNGLHGVVPDRFSMVVGHGDVILFFFANSGTWITAGIGPLTTWTRKRKTCSTTCRK